MTANPATMPLRFKPKVPTEPGLYYYCSPAINPFKIAILCEELNIPYTPIQIDTLSGEQRSEWYTKINPNGRLPAIVHVKDERSAPVVVWESAACMLYILSEFDIEGKMGYGYGSQEYWEMVAWLSWQVAGLGPMMGQAAHFTRYSTEDVPYGVKRYTAECRRLFQILDKQLSISDFIAGDKYTIADIAIFIWALTAAWCGIDIDEFPAVKSWRDKIHARPAVQRGLKVPVAYPFTDQKVKDPKRKKWFDMVQESGKKIVAMELRELTEGRDGKVESKL